MDAFSADRSPRQEVASGMPVEPVLHVRASLSPFDNFSTGGGSRSPELAVESCRGILWSKRVYRLKSLSFTDLSEESDGSILRMSPQTVALGAAGRHRQPVPWASEHKLALRIESVII